MSADLYKNEAAFSAPAAVHGWVRKSGPVDLRQWHVNYHEAKAREFRDYIKNWRDSDEDYLDAPSTVIGRCMILVVRWLWSFCPSLSSSFVTTFRM